MKTKPKKLDYLALFLLGVCFSMPLQIMILYEHTPLEMGTVFAKLAPLNWLVLMLAPLTAWFIYRASPLVLIAVPLLMITVVHNNWLVAEMSSDYPALLVGASTGFFLLSMGSLASTEIRELLLNPNRRWWLTPKRKRVNIPVNLVVPERGEFAFQSQTFDVSETGAFLVTSTEMQSFLKHLESGTDCSISLQIGDNQSLKCRAEVVRSIEPPNQKQVANQQPSGIGIRFVGLRREQRRALNQIVEKT